MNELRTAAASDPPAGSHEVGTVMVSDTDTAMPALWSYFGNDDDRDACHLIVGDEDVGFLGRGTVLQGMTDQVRGLGDPSAGAMLPGLATGYEEIELRCDEPGCALNPIVTLTYDYDFPPHCPLHPQRALHPPEAQ